MRLFVAIVPPPEAVALVAALPRADVPRVRWTTEEQWHVTLRFLGECPADEVVAALRTVAWPPAPEAVLRGDVRSFGRDLLYVPVDGVDALAAAVAASTRGVGAPAPGRPFTGHLTLARARRGGDVRPLARAAVAGETAEVRWRADEVVLMASELRPSGSRYSLVERFSVEGA
ncbi:MAG: RNA 2',3'-cyclic phosphodiesterase [Actinobacteria bacterium]|nr:RNA 2',3'-cyclic phosphodiesterase [Actinomycetota bacterium]